MIDKYPNQANIGSMRFASLTHARIATAVSFQSGGARLRRPLVKLKTEDVYEHLKIHKGA